MAATGAHLGHYVKRNGRFLLNNIEQLWAYRGFGWTSALRQQAAEANKEPTDAIVIPRKKTWSKEAVLAALASTTSRCLMPETVSLLLEVSEEALKERISLRKVSAAVEMYDQLLQAGTAVSMETSHDLLDLICLYCDRDPVQEGEEENLEQKQTHLSTLRSWQQHHCRSLTAAR
ncbi:small ribosomal subunit protein mS39-like [Centropristis striata]|uniref:small ribosomal subunit protein mS39-like n=1 Tax=Centropristis striata TaxID=184440 RepID=UPI0027E186E0|nr:small ribosomal subunit protein mS39-like [Centropristis striata]